VIGLAGGGGGDNKYRKALHITSFEFKVSCLSFVANAVCIEE
jgi:hypothetical protein